MGYFVGIGAAWVGWWLLSGCGGGKVSPAGSVVRYRLPLASTAPALRRVLRERGGVPRASRPTGEFWVGGFVRRGYLIGRNRADDIRPYGKEKDQARGWVG